jgi:truncated hemoglobin YjbI
MKSSPAATSQARSSTSSSSSSSVSLDSAGTGKTELTLSEALNSEALTLYNRMGGEDRIGEMTRLMFEEMGRRKELDRFFDDVAIHAIRMHQAKFFKVLFGLEEERPTMDELLDYVIVTHVRLFRDKGLDETHFDIIGECFVATLQALEVPPDQVGEIFEIIGPLRAAFEYGAKVAQKEKKMDETKKERLPMASMETMRNQEPAVLPMGVPPPMPWLCEALGGREEVRKWTTALTQRFLVDDEVLQAVFMLVPYLDMEPYLLNLIHVSFQDEKGGAIGMLEAKKMARTLRFPLGLSHAKARVDTKLFMRMEKHFEDVARKLLLDGDIVKLEIVMKRLRSYRGMLGGGSHPATKENRINGCHTPHKLKRDATDCTFSDTDSYQTPVPCGTAKKQQQQQQKRQPKGLNAIFTWLLSRRQAQRFRDLKKQQQQQQQQHQEQKVIITTAK